MRPRSLRISTISRYLLPPILNTVRHCPRKLAEAKSSRLVFPPLDQVLRDVCSILKGANLLSHRLGDSQLPEMLSRGGNEERPCGRDAGLEASLSSSGTQATVVGCR